MNYFAWFLDRSSHKQLHIFFGVERWSENKWNAFKTILTVPATLPQGHTLQCSEKHNPTASLSLINVNGNCSTLRKKTVQLWFVWKGLLEKCPFSPKSPQGSHTSGIVKIQTKQGKRTGHILYWTTCQNISVIEDCYYFITVHSDKYCDLFVLAKVMFVVRFSRTTAPTSRLYE